jgi:hypothetical protein
MRRRLPPRNSFLQITPSLEANTRILDGEGEGAMARGKKMGRADS